MTKSEQIERLGRAYGELRAIALDLDPKREGKNALASACFAHAEQLSAWHLHISGYAPEDLHDSEEEQ